MSDKVTLTWRNKEYTFTGLTAKYLQLCGYGFIYGGFAGSIIGAVTGLSVCVASPVIIGLVAVKIVKNRKMF